MKKIAVSITLSLFSFFVSAQSPCLPEGITFTTQAEIDSFHANYPGCMDIEGDVTIEEGVTNLSGLSGLKSIGGNLCLHGTLTNLQGLEELTSIGGWLFIGIYYGPSPLLTDLNSLQNLTSIGGYLSIWCNTSLTSLTGLSNLTSIGGDLGILGNTSLTSLAGLSNLTSIGDNLSIEVNHSLTSLVGLGNIDPGSIGELQITNNDLLRECEVQSVCNYLAAPNGTVTIENNAPGCNNKEEVEEACESQGIESNNLRSLNIHPNPTDNGTITITLDNPHNIHLTCFNTYRQQVHRQEINSPETVINVSTWTPGIYVAVVYENGIPVSRAKFVVR